MKVYFQKTHKSSIWWRLYRTDTISYSNLKPPSPFLLEKEDIEKVVNFLDTKFSKIIYKIYTDVRLNRFTSDRDADKKIRGYLKYKKDENTDEYIKYYQCDLQFLVCLGSISDNSFFVLSSIDGIEIYESSCL